MPDFSYVLSLELMGVSDSPDGYNLRDDTGRVLMSKKSTKAKSKLKTKAAAGQTASCSKQVSTVGLAQYARIYGTAGRSIATTEARPSAQITYSAASRLK